MSESDLPEIKCHYCGAPFAAPDAYCSRCGNPTGTISWSLSSNRQPGETIQTIRPGEPLFLIALNVGLAPIAVKVDAKQARGLRLLGTAQAWAERHSAAVFELEHLRGMEIGGILRVSSEDGPRPAEKSVGQQWWIRRTWREEALRLQQRVRLVEDHWIIGSPVLLFPPGVRQQIVRVWNDAPQSRDFLTDLPDGYQVFNFFGLNPVEKFVPDVAPGGALDLIARKVPGRSESLSASEWLAGPDAERIPLRSLSASAREAGPDVIIAIDFGTRNTSVRVRWRRALLATKPKGTVDIVGDQTGSARFPTEMVLHRRGRTSLWGTEAAHYIAQNRLTADEVAIENLKTHLRENVEPFVASNPLWTNEELLGTYFERLFARLDEYFETADPNTPLSRHDLKIRYVLSRPVLDANNQEGDARGELYERALKRAMQRCDVPEEQIVFVLEPEAAAIGIAHRRAQELIGLDGEVIAVIDAGGGTTDISLARVKLRDGGVALDILGSYALHLQPDNPAITALDDYKLNDREVGGNTLDYALAHRLLNHATDLLETDLRPVPPRLVLSSSGEMTESQKREFVTHCRHIKEGFAFYSDPHLNRPAGQAAREGENLPFANRPEYEGVYLVQDFYDQFLLTPILTPTVGDLAERITESQPPPDGVRPSRVRRVFYVGGTNIDPNVRRHFGAAFPNARENDPAAQSLERQEERLFAVVEGGVWHEERLFATAPLTLTLHLDDTETVLLMEGATLPPRIKPSVRPFPVELEPQAELCASLIASGSVLSESVCVARGFYRNTTETKQEATLRLTISREDGVVGTLMLDTRAIDQWRFRLVETLA